MNRPEAKLQADWENYLTLRGWYVKRTHGNMYQSGFPDLFATHSKFCARWIEIKLPEMKGSRFTPSQVECFPKFAANGTGVWILTTVCQEEYDKLFKPCNFWIYMSM